MRRHFLPFLVAIAVCATADAQAPTAPREIDTPILTDDDGALEYGGCAQEQCAPGFDNDGLDLIGLDGREAFLPDGRPAMAFRVLFQWQVPDVSGRDIEVTFNVSQAPHQVLIVGADTPAAQSADVDRVVGALQLEGSEAWAVEVWLAYDRLGLVPGDQIEDLRVMSRNGAAPRDIMPGVWYSQGQIVPHLPHSPDVTEAIEEHPPGRYTLKGSAPLLQFVSQTPDRADFPRTWTVVVRNALAALPQSVTVIVDPAGNASVVPPMLVIPAGGQASFNVTGNQPGPLNVTLSSDLGGRQSLTFAIYDEPAAESPGIGLAVVAFVLLSLAFRRRD